MATHTGLSALEQELLQEQASALGRIGGQLDRLIAACHRLEAEARAALGDQREKLVTRHRARRREALTYRWYLEIQRECIGQYNHDLLDKHYPVPPRLDLD